MTISAEKLSDPLTSQTFLRAVELEEIEAAPSATGLPVRSFTAQTQYVPWPKAYGGDLVAQGLAAMIKTVDAPKVVHSSHSYFMRPADIGALVQYDVEVLRDGRGFSTRQVRAIQNDKVIFISSASFQVPVEGDHFALKADPALLNIDPESLPSSADALIGRDDAAGKYWSTGRSFEMRHVSSPIYEGEVTDQSSQQGVWVKAFEALPKLEDPQDTANLHRIGLTYACDYTILEALMRHRGLTWSSEGLVTASLDHSMWFHREPNIDEWILYQQAALSSQSQRGLAEGHFFDREGNLLATVAQEGMIRI